MHIIMSSVVAVEPISCLPELVVHIEDTFAVLVPPATSVNLETDCRTCFPFLPFASYVFLQCFFF